MIFEIINPSDACTLEAFDHEVASIACCFIGSGKYALKGIDTDLEVPLFIFGDHDEWFTASFNKGMDLIDDPIKKEEWQQHWLDERRTSLNNICARAWDYAKHFDGLSQGGAA